MKWSDKGDALDFLDFFNVKMNIPRILSIERMMYSPYISISLLSVVESRRRQVVICLCVECLEWLLWRLLKCLVERQSLQLHLRLHGLPRAEQVIVARVDRTATSTRIRLEQ